MRTDNLINAERGNMPGEMVRPTEKDVLFAIKKEVGEGLKGQPRTASELARSISMTYGHPYWEDPQVHRPSLNKVLDKLSADFTIIRRSGDGWGDLPPSQYGMAARFFYYALPEHAEEWRREALSRTEKRRLKLAEEQARHALAEQFPTEYQVLVRRELKKVELTMKAPE